MILFSGALLLTPGFFTDAVGFALLIPGVRSALWAWGMRNIKIQTVHTAHMRTDGTWHSTRGTGGQTVDGEFTEVPPDPPRSDTRPPLDRT